MNANSIRKPDQIRLITECRQSGLSDYQWCREQGIKPGTFYNWISRLRKAGYTIPDSESQIRAVPVRQEVVRLDLIERETVSPAIAEQNTSIPTTVSNTPIAAEIECGNIKIRFFNGADSFVIQNTLKYIGGMPHAW